MSFQSVPGSGGKAILTSRTSAWSRAGSLRTLFSVYLIYRPLRLFCALSLLFLTPGLVLAARYLYFFFVGEGKGHVQSVIVGGVLVVCGIFMLAIATVAHLLAINRQLLEELRYLQRRGSIGKP